MALIKKFRIKNFKEEETLLELNKISMFYNKRQILNNLNLKINRQEVLGMLGPNGVGKSTIFHIVTGLKNPSFGKVLINGVDCTNIPIYERATRFRLGYVPQYGGFIQDLNLIENLQLVGEIHIKDKNLRKTKIEKIISQFEFDPLLKIKAKFLSGGQKKKLVISMALINDPNILLLDEPFAALDILTIKMLQEIIVNLQSLEKITVVVCDHQARDLLSCVDRAIVLSNGKIIASGSPNEIIKDSSAKLAYFGDEFKIN
jgi:lipopolysaccharide export system ATP-binding protein|tara:strand:- start:6773 stop:7549 length:777 start_codon:yes stop_codon:yes gene_type:complete